MSGSAAAAEPRAAVALSDRRLLDFWPAALRAVIESQGPTLLGLPPNITVTGVSLRPADNSLDVELEGKTVRVAEGQLAGMLISYCIGARIPIPVRAAKTMRVLPTHVALAFSMSYDYPPRADRAAPKIVAR